MDFIDYYEILEVHRKASIDVMKKAYAVLAKKYHPDVNPNNEFAHIKMKQLNEAYQILSDPIKRKKYDLRYDQLVNKNGYKEKPSNKSYAKQQETKQQETKQQETKQQETKQQETNKKDSRSTRSIIIGYVLVFIVLGYFIDKSVYKTYNKNVSVDHPKYKQDVRFDPKKVEDFKKKLEDFKKKVEDLKKNLKMLKKLEDVKLDPEPIKKIKLVLLEPEKPKSPKIVFDETNIDKQNDKLSGYFGIGSSKEDVIKSMGTPTSIDSYLN
ncbi:MAG: J domain-containing protein, partial [Candidatus Auribacter fodinae]